MHPDHAAKSMAIALGNRTPNRRWRRMNRALNRRHARQIMRRKRRQEFWAAFDRRAAG